MRKTALCAALLLTLAPVDAQNRTTYTDSEQTIRDRIKTLRSLADPEWVKTVGELARGIQQLPASSGRTSLILSLGYVCTEGDAGRESLQIIADTMVQELAASPKPSLAQTLAQLVRYEHLKVTTNNPAYQEAMAKLAKLDEKRRSLDFTLTDLNGKQWSMKDLRGKVVLLNFWATWCPPCRREMPDMEALYHRFGPKGLVILAISDEEKAKVESFLVQHKYSYPILLDPGRKVNELFGVEGIPKTFLYGRDGELVATAIDRRTERQFLELLKMAKLE